MKFYQMIEMEFLSLLKGYLREDFLLKNLLHLQILLEIMELEIGVFKILKHIHFMHFQEVENLDFLQ